jgi:peptidoglycan/xylan/chitin deacetylase (PgdA/CDA1 family)
LSKKYVVFKNDDVGKDTPKLKKWIDIVLKNDAKATIGLIGKYMKNQDLIEYLKTLDKDRIEIFCHGYSHSHLPFLLIKKIGRNRIYPTEFDRNFNSHNSSLKKFRDAESKYLDKKAICFGPQGNIWNDSIIDALVQNDFKLMFSWRKAKHDLFIIPLCNNLRQNSIDEFIKVYEKGKNNQIYTLQFHHADLSDKQFDLIVEVIDFLINKESRIFVTPSEILKISKKDKVIYDLMAPTNMK